MRLSDCAERRTLVEQYHAALRDYFNVASAVTEVSLCDQAERAFEQATYARLKFERISDLYRQHVMVHGCSSMDLANFC